MMQRWPLGEEIRYDGTAHPLVKALPHYHMVPKDQVGHLKWRLELRRKCQTSATWRSKVREMCENDPLWFINSWCWLVEPRGTGRIPFNTWPHQDVWLAATAHYSGWTEKELQRDQILRKSRAQGATWGIAAEYVRAFLFRRACIQGFVSKDEDTADNPSNPNSFGWKIYFILRNLPPWMVGDFERKSSDHTWRLVARENYLMGAAATGAGFRGGRLWRAFMDESAFWLHGQDAAFVENLRAVTDCRIIASTPNGQNNKFYDLVHSPSSWLNLILHWQDNPDQNEGLYTTENGKLKILKGEAKPNYPYVLDGRVRSFWYDAECQRSGGNMIEISRELDIDFGGSKGRPFSAAVVNKHKATCCTPMHRGDLLLKDPADLHESEWGDQEAGPITMWVPITNGRPPRGSRVVGCDISAGTAGDLSSNSVAIIFDAITREQIAEVVRNDLPGAEFADYVAAVCYWFGWDGTNPYLIWEKNGGAGSLFTKRMMNIQYPNMYFQPSKDDDRLYAKTGDRPGYHNSNKYITISPLILAMTHGTVTLKSIHLVTECGEYVYVEGASSKIEHPKSRTGFDASAQGENHGDRAIAAAVAVRALDERPKAKRPESQWDQLGKAPDGSIGRRIYENALAKGDPISCEW